MQVLKKLLNTKLNKYKAHKRLLMIHTVMQEQHQKITIHQIKKKLFPLHHKQRHKMKRLLLKKQRILL